MMVWQHQLVGVLDHHDPLIRWDGRRKRAQERALSRPGRAAHDNVPAAADRIDKECRGVTAQGVARYPRCDAGEWHRQRTKLPDGETWASHRLDPGVPTRAVSHPRVDEWLLHGQLAADAGGDPIDKVR